MEETLATAASPDSKEREARDLRIESSPARLRLDGPEKGESTLEYIQATLLPTMVAQAESNYRNGYQADVIASTEFFRNGSSVRRYCQTHGLLLGPETRDSSGNASANEWIALALPHLASANEWITVALPHLALPRVITTRAFEEGWDAVPHILLILG